jgi:hypothetical protein
MWKIPTPFKTSKCTKGRRLIKTQSKEANFKDQPHHFQMMEIQLVSKHQRDHLQKHRKKGHNNTYIKTEVSSPKKNENTLIQRSAPNVS